ncbi:MAG: hypothetical protein AAF587_29595 [Bacteroidota bacterium]
MDKKEAGYQLWISGFSQNEVAKVLGVAPKTITNWKRGQGWEDRRRKETSRQSDSENLVWNLYLHNLKVLNHQIGLWEKSTDPEDKLKMVDKGAADSLLKFYTQIKDKHIAWKQVIKLMREFLGFVYSEDVVFAQKLDKTNLIDDFINYKRKEA